MQSTVDVVAIHIKRLLLLRLEFFQHGKCGVDVIRFLGLDGDNVIGFYELCYCWTANYFGVE